MVSTRRRLLAHPGPDENPHTSEPEAGNSPRSFKTPRQTALSRAHSLSLQNSKKKTAEKGSASKAKNRRNSLMSPALGRVGRSPLVSARTRKTRNGKEKENENEGETGTSTTGTATQRDEGNCPPPPQNEHGNETETVEKENETGTPRTCATSSPYNNEKTSSVGQETRFVAEEKREVEKSETQYEGEQCHPFMPVCTNTEPSSKAPPPTDHEFVSVAQMNEEQAPGSPTLAVVSLKITELIMPTVGETDTPINHAKPGTKDGANDPLPHQDNPTLSVMHMDCEQEGGAVVEMEKVEEHTHTLIPPNTQHEPANTDRGKQPTDTLISSGSVIPKETAQQEVCLSEHSITTSTPLVFLEDATHPSPLIADICDSPVKVLSAPMNTTDTSKDEICSSLLQPMETDENENRQNGNADVEMEHSGEVMTAHAVVHVQATEHAEENACAEGTVVNQTGDLDTEMDDVEPSACTCPIVPTGRSTTPTTTTIREEPTPIGTSLRQQQPPTPTANEYIEMNEDVSAFLTENTLDHASQAQAHTVEPSLHPPTTPPAEANIVTIENCAESVEISEPNEPPTEPTFTLCTPVDKEVDCVEMVPETPLSTPTLSHMHTEEPSEGFFPASSYVSSELLDVADMELDLNEHVGVQVVGHHNEPYIDGVPPRARDNPSSPTDQQEPTLTLSLHPKHIPHQPTTNSEFHSQFYTSAPQIGHQTNEISQFDTTITNTIQSPTTTTTTTAVTTTGSTKLNTEPHTFPTHKPSPTELTPPIPTTATPTHSFSSPSPTPSILSNVTSTLDLTFTVSDTVPSPPPIIPATAHPASFAQIETTVTNPIATGNPAAITTTQETSLAQTNTTTTDTTHQTSFVHNTTTTTTLDSHDLLVGATESQMELDAALDSLCYFSDTDWIQPPHENTIRRCNGSNQSPAPISTSVPIDRPNPRDNHKSAPAAGPGRKTPRMSPYTRPKSADLPLSARAIPNSAHRPLRPCVGCPDCIKAHSRLTALIANMDSLNERVRRLGLMQ